MTLNSFSSRKIIIASGNIGKVREFKSFFKHLPLVVLEMSKGFEVEETGETFLQNASLKALAAAQFSGEWCLADDSGLCVESLDGAPGVRSARYASSDAKRVNRLLKELDGKKNRRASFLCAICVASPEKGILLKVEGRCEGLITHSPRGLGGFGYDPIFEVPSTGLTFAEMTIEQKRSLGHRGSAFAQLEDQLRKILNEMD